MVSVAVLTGGPSHEHDISLASARNVVDALRSAGRSVRVVFLSRSGRWTLGAPDASVDEVAGAGDGEAAGTSSHVDASAAAVLDALAADGDVALLVLHGTFGEDGSIQRLLEARGVPYTGAGPIASAMAMDKELMKMAASKLGVACARHDVVEPDAEIDKRRLVAISGLPCVVKPLNGGSSLGVTYVDDKRFLKSAVERARDEDPRGRVLVEEFVVGTDVNCSVLRRDGVVTALPLVSVETDDDVVDVHAKYESDSTRFHCPAPLDDALAARISAVSVALFEHLGLRGVAHVDFLVPADGGDPVFLEVNTLPGFTDRSHVPRASAALGLPLADVLDAVLADAHHPRRNGDDAQRSAGA